MNQIPLGTFAGGTENGTIVDLREYGVGTRGLGWQLWVVGSRSAGTWKLEMGLDSAHAVSEQAYGIPVTAAGGPPDGAAVSLTGRTEAGLAYMLMGPFSPYCRMVITSLTGSLTFTLVTS